MIISANQVVIVDRAVVTVPMGGKVACLGCARDVGLSMMTFMRPLTKTMYDDKKRVKSKLGSLYSVSLHFYSVFFHCLFKFTFTFLFDICINFRLVNARMILCVSPVCHSHGP